MNTYQGWFPVGISVHHIKWLYCHFHLRS